MFVCLMGVSLGACGEIPSPRPLVELRRELTGGGLAAELEAAPDLTAEARRSWREAEAALERRDVARARWMASLGLIQIELARLALRRLRARQRSSRAHHPQQEIQEDLDRFESIRREGEAESLSSCPR